METIKREWTAKIAIILFIVFTVWWTILRITTVESNNLNQIFASLYGIVALWGAICGIVFSKKWGGFYSVLGKSMIFFSLGLFAQEFGQIAYSYYLYTTHAVPYPSLGDLGYFGSIPFYILAVWFLGKTAGVNIGLKSFKSKLQAIIIPLLILGLSYYLFFQGYIFDWSNPIKVLLDVGYPFGEAIYISLAIIVYLLTRNLLGGVMKKTVLFILFALLIQFLSDYTFLYFSQQNQIYAGGPNDYLYLVAYFLMTMGLLQFKVSYDKLSKPSG